MDKKNKENIMKEALQRYVRYLSLSNTEDSLLHKSFKEKLNHIEPEQSLTNKIKSKINMTASIVGSSLFITGFLIARLTLPVASGIKGVEDKPYIENLSTKIIEISSEKEFEAIITHAVTEEISFEFESNHNVKQLYILGLHKNSNFEFKKILELSQAYEGPLTIIVNN